MASLVYLHKVYRILVYSTVYFVSILRDFDLLGVVMQGLGYCQGARIHQRCLDDRQSN